MKLFTRFSALGLAATALLGGSCLSTSSSSGLQSDTESAIGLFLQSVDWGRLVDVRDRNGVLVESDVLISHLIETDGISYEILTNPVSQKETLTIQQDAGTAAFTTLLNAAQGNLENVVEKGTNGAPPFSEVARNATIRLQFSRQIDPSTVDFSTVQIYTGTPPLLAFTGRYVVKNDAASDTGYVYFDTTVSAVEAANEAVPQNAVGFPASSDSINTNLAIKIPTQPDPLSGQPKVITSLDGRFSPSVKDMNSEPFEVIGTSNVLVRAARTGNSLDNFRGFLLDNTRPNLLGVQAATINTVSSVSGTTVEFLYTMNAANCKPLAPKVGDVFEVGAGLLMVTDVLSSVDPDNFSVRAAIEATDTSIVAGATSLAARYTTRYTPQDAALQSCYLEIQPPPLANMPVGLIDEKATVTVRFDEPIEASSVRSMSTFVIASPDDAASPTTDEEVEAAWFRQVTPAETVGDFIDRQRGYDFRAILGGAEAGSEFGGRILFGNIEAVDGNKQFTLSPLIGWIDPDSTDLFEEYVVALRGGVDGIQDLTGNTLDLAGFVAGNEGQAAGMAISVFHGSSDDADTKYFSVTGGTLDEDGDGQAEWSGQVNILPNGLTGRPTSRFSRAADSSSPAMSNRSVGTPVNEPLNPAGAVVMHVYRPQEFGFGYPDATEYNMTVEGFNWSPNAGVVLDESFSDISLSLGTSIFLPDEWLDPLTGATVFPNSGLITSAFDDNILGFTADGSSGVDEVEVFRNNYNTNSINLFTANGTPFLPWPDFTTDYVWRDTTIPQTFLGTAAAPNSQGSPDLQFQADTGAFLNWLPETAPSVGLPLLCRFRTYPQSESIGLNSFSVTKMMPPGNQLVNYRMWSSGGQDGSGIWHLVQPDNPAFGGTVPTGGFQPGGQPTPTAADDLIYWSQAEFAVNVSRIYSHWFDMGTILQAGDIRGTVLEPANADQPVGTSIVVEYRGSAAVSHFGDPDVNTSPLTAADTPFDDYGDSIVGIGSVSTPSLWTTDITELEDQGFRYFQVRVTFNANADLGLRPELDGLGIVWKN
ncbi:MAG: hypothetical protein ACYTEP_11620 [Planctomycetota bacterium]|jgi:hypothetical protein